MHTNSQTNRRSEASRTASVDVAHKFQACALKWKTETSHMSSVSDITSHPAYMEIIGMGSAVVPLIIRDLVLEVDDWFTALNVITGENPVKPEDAGKMGKMRDAWIDWTKTRGIA